MGSSWKQRDDWGELLLGEMLLFGLLGKVLYTYPESGWFDELVKESLFDDVPFAAQETDVKRGLSLLQAWQESFSLERKSSLEDLQAEYSRLFIISDDLPLSPYESVYFSEDRLLFEERTLEVRRWYRRFDLELVNVRREPDDHIGLELAFVAMLAQRALKALDAADYGALGEMLEAQREFCRRHLFSWAFLWCDQMVEFGHTNFYNGVSLVLRGALSHLAELLGVTIAEVSGP